MKKTTCLVSLFFFLLFAPAGGAEMRPVKKLRAGLPPYEIIGKILQANQQAAPSAPASKAAQRITPYMTWLADPDARVYATLLLTRPEDKIYAVRNLANQLEPAAGAVDYGVRSLHTPVLLITGNSGNEAIRFFLKGYAHLDASMRQEIDHLHLALDRTAKTPQKKESPFEERWLAAVEQNVDYQVKLATARYRDRVAGGRLVVVGGVIDLLNQYGLGKNRLVIINVNGETDTGKLRALRLMARLDKNLLATVGRARRLPQKGSPRQ